jgi:hypothetical protein
MESWVLDLVIKDASLVPTGYLGPLWFVIRADGLSEQFATPRASAISGPTWNYSARLLLKSPDVSKGYLYFQLCTFGPGGQGRVTVAVSRIGIRVLPRGCPMMFSFPVVRPGNAAQEVARVTIVSALMPVPALNRSYCGNSIRGLDADRRNCSA